MSLRRDGSRPSLGSRRQFSPVGAWLSLVEHSVRDRGVGGSNPLAPTNFLRKSSKNLAISRGQLPAPLRRYLLLSRAGTALERHCARRPRGAPPPLPPPPTPDKARATRPDACVWGPASLPLRPCGNRRPGRFQRPQGGAPIAQPVRDCRVRGELARSPPDGDGPAEMPPNGHAQARTPAPTALVRELKRAPALTVSGVRASIREFGWTAPATRDKDPLK